ncbi:hypothetical protein GCM10025882_31720 [Acinetobacter gyllenbergii]|uniref:Lipoprotein n=1 Tax=Acinetobacter gyllenbergii CIP 110306 = MTCC 11365 TaxID=1217657 RepID=A0A829HBC6_9GAMM|nr:hypothetical protein [Acinetobacter gyllenbergii]EPF72546.1 hypothetical protein F957_03682 [Acinetobacter gyllenbergii CIP 110306 = MTCC 11365]EPH31071.1 hypothetical protein L293_2474 [Acinetobacter gyllenbergii CIP 110306 = MTCC 11365]GMA12747.1 hypothetical protein GCM10025882_31720 [Acinetobacter gyllenbergii]
MKKIILFGMFGLLIGLSGCGKKEPTEKELNINREMVAQESVKKILKDPDSAKFQNMKGLCGEVNSKNGFGVYSGYVRFIGTPELTIIEGESSQVDQATFNEVWSKMCK